MADSRLVVFGGTSGIGQTAFHTISQRMDVKYAWRYGIEDFDIRKRGNLREVLYATKPTHVVYSVGINKLDWIANVRHADFLDVMDVNVYGFLNVLRVMEEEKLENVSVVAVTSDAAWRPMRTSAVYCASKAAQEMAVRVASREYAGRGWRINAVAPGKVEGTAMTEYVDRRVLETRGWTKEFAEEYERQSSPLGRKVTKAEVAEVIESVLFGPQAQTGEIVAVNGGR